MNRAILIFILINIFSFISFWFKYPVGLVFSIFAVIFLAINLKSFLKVLFNSRSVLFLIFLFFEIFSFTNYLFNDYSRKIILSNPELLIQGISYLLVPQILFYYLGFKEINKSLPTYEGNLKIIVDVFAFVFIYGIYLHFARPSYFSSFLDRTFLTDPNTGYQNFYPKMTIYWNSMIIGVLAVSLFWLNIFVPNRNSIIKIFYAFVFLTAIIFSTQRGAWISFIISGIFVFITNFQVKRIFQYLLLITITGLSVFLILRFATISNNVEIFVDLFNRFDALDKALSERNYQFENFLILISDNPFGVGLGLLSHKAADLQLLLTTPDGNYYRILGELGYLGFCSFFVLILFLLLKLYKTRLKLLFVILFVYLLQSIGTNVMDLYAASFLFWFIIGSIAGYDSNISRQ